MSSQLKLHCTLTNLLAVTALLLALLFPLAGHAQLSGHNTKGDFGLQSGTQAPPGFYVVALYYDYSADTLRDGNGDRFDPLGGGGSVDAKAMIVGGLWVTDKKLLGGTTVYFDEARTWHFAATAFYETHGEKDGTDIRVGDILTLEGGLGKSFMDGAVNVGVAYYAQWKLTDDDFGLGFTPPGGSILDRHRVYGIGPISIPLASKSKLYGFLNLRYFWETGARTTLEGNAFLATFSLPVPSIPLQ